MRLVHRSKISVAAYSKGTLFETHIQTSSRAYYLNNGQNEIPEHLLLTILVDERTQVCQTAINRIQFPRKQESSKQKIFLGNL